MGPKFFAGLRIDALDDTHAIDEVGEILVNERRSVTSIRFDVRPCNMGLCDVAFTAERDPQAPFMRWDGNGFGWSRIGTDSEEVLRSRRGPPPPSRSPPLPIRIECSKYVGEAVLLPASHIDVPLFATMVHIVSSNASGRGDNRQLLLILGNKNRRAPSGLRRVIGFPKRRSIASRRAST